MAPGTISKFGAPMFEPVFPKQMYCTEESTCDIAGPFRRPTQRVGTPMVIRHPGNCASRAPLITPLPHAFINCKAASTPRPLSRACYASTTTHYGKTVALWHAIARGSDIVTEQERSLAISTRPRPSHAIRMDKSVPCCISGKKILVRIWLRRVFKSVAVRIWLLRK